MYGRLKEHVCRERAPPTQTDIEVLHEREDWQVQSEEGGIVTSLPVLFENIVVETLLALKEIVIVKSVDEDGGEMAGEVHSKDNKELRDNTVGHFQGLWDVRTQYKYHTDHE